MEIGAPELLIVLVLVVLLFGRGRLGKTLGALGAGLRSFKDNLSGDNKHQDAPEPSKEKPEKVNNG